MIVPMKLEHLLFIVHEMDGTQLEEMMCMTFDKDVAAYAASMYLAAGVKVTVHADGEPWVCGGLTVDGPGRGTMWMVHRPGWERHIKETMRCIKDIVEKSETRYIQAYVLAANETNNRFIKHIGLELKTTLECYGDGGQDFNLYTRVDRGLV
jgi:hypothetical protein